MNENDKDIFSEENPPEKDSSQNTDGTADTHSADDSTSNLQEESPNNEETVTEAFSWDFVPPKEETVSVKPKKKRLSAGAKFGIIMAIVFSVAFIAFWLSLIFDYTFPYSDEDTAEEQESADINISDYNSEGYEHNYASAEALEDFNYSVVVIEASHKTPMGNNSKSTGTGVILDSNGYIITNQHVIADAETVKVTLYDGETVVAKIVGESPRNDIAVIKIDYEYVMPAVFGKSESVVLGQRIYAVGTPKNIDFAWTVTQGIVSCVEREVKIYNDNGILDKTMKMIQTDAPLNSGNSGGPIIDSDCNVIGIVTMKLTDTQGIGFAIPIDGALEIAQEIIKNGSTDGNNSSISTGRPLIGISGFSVAGETWYAAYGSSYAKVSEEFAAQNPENSFYAEVDGVYVSSVNQGFDAENKLKTKDIIVEIDGEDVFTIYDIVEHIGELKVGDTVHLKVYRDSKYIEVDVIIGTDK